MFEASELGMMRWEVLVSHGLEEHGGDSWFYLECLNQRRDVRSLWLLAGWEWAGLGMGGRALVTRVRVEMEKGSRTQRCFQRELQGIVMEWTVG